LATKSITFCRECNNEKLGKYDRCLSETFAPFTLCYDIDQDRGKISPKLEGVDEEGNLIVFDHNFHPEFKKLVKQKEEQEIIGSYHSGKAKRIFNNMNAKREKKKIENEYKGKSSEIKVTIPIGSIDTLRAITKIYFVALHLFNEHYKSNEFKRDFLLNNANLNNYDVRVINYNDFLPFLVNHGIIILYGNKKPHNILATVILYNICYLISDIDETYKGDSFCVAYFMNPLTKEEIFEPNYNFSNTIPKHESKEDINEIDLIKEELLSARIYCEVRRFSSNKSCVISSKNIVETIQNEVIRGTMNYRNKLSIMNIKAILNPYSYTKRIEKLELGLKIWQDMITHSHD